MPNPTIEQITLPSGSTYDLVDAGAREMIEGLSGFTKFLGVTTTALYDGSTANPITIDGESVTADSGSIATYGSKEFVFNGTTWQEFGDLSALGTLAYKNSVAVTTTATGTVSKPTFTGSATTSTGTFTPAGSVALTNTNQSTTVSKASSGTATYTPEGTNASSAVSGTCSVTASGSVAAPTISVATAGSTTTIKNPTSKTVVTDMSIAAPNATQATGELVYCSVSNKVLTLSKFVETTGASISTANVTVKTGDAVYSASAPEFTGSASSGTISGTAAAQKFTGTGARLVTGNISVPSSASFTGTEGSVSVSGTPEGSVSQPSFTGNAVSGVVTYSPS